MTERQTEVCGLLKAGLTYKEIEDRTGYDQHNARKLALRLGLAYTDEARKAEQLERVRTVVRSCGAEYVEGYVTNTSAITVRLDCGHERRMKWTSVMDTQSKGEKIQCDECQKLKKKPPKPPKMKTIKGEQMRFSSCPVCGGIVTRGTYCSKRCKEKAHNKTNEVRRNRLINKSRCDSTITLEKLWDRDGGVCQLCGTMCDRKDYEEREGCFVAGNDYPSIDHIVPLALGGSHTWDNVQLAHRRCNSVKGKRVSPGGQNA